MIERDAAARARAASWDDAPFSQLLFRYLWPFWLFKDATRGDWRARAAAYRHNRTMRVHLPGYLVRWLLGSALTFALTAAFDSLALAAGPVYSAHFYTALAAGGGILFAGSVCVLVMTGYVYLYLAKHDL